MLGFNKYFFGFIFLSSFCSIKISATLENLKKALEKNDMAEIKNNIQYFNQALLRLAINSKKLNIWELIQSRYPIEFSFILRTYDHSLGNFILNSLEDKRFDVVSFITKKYPKIFLKKTSQIGHENTLLHIAAQQYNKDVIEYVLKIHEKEFLTLKNFYNQTPIALAIEHNELSIIKFLQEKFPLEFTQVVKKLTNETLLHIAANYGKVEIVKFLYTKYRNEFRTITDLDGYTPLMAVIDRSEFEEEFQIDNFSKIDTKKNNNLDNLKKILKNIQTKLTQLTSKLSAFTATNIKQQTTNKPITTQEAIDRVLSQRRDALNAQYTRASMAEFIEGKVNAYRARLMKTYEIVDK